MDLVLTPGDLFDVDDPTRPINTPEELSAIPAEDVRALVVPAIADLSAYLDGYDGSAPTDVQWEVIETAQRTLGALLRIVGAAREMSNREAVIASMRAHAASLAANQAEGA